MEQMSDTPGKRIYDPQKLLNPDVIADVLNQFRNTVKKVFSDNLAFGFICGGFAKGYAVQNQDFDCFICLHTINNNQINEFRKWYFKLHSDHNLLPDINDPGEIMTIAVLSEKTDFVKNTNLRPIVETYYEYEATVWCDILCGTKAAKIGDLYLLELFEQSCELLPQRWRREILEILGNDIDIETAKLPITRLFRKAIRYHKLGDNIKPVFI